ncbi:hypothetical protein [Nucisporomicrobium flavum]|uniref:hypothetical protein n=1 Tax=Nucisporomicrobium flavum TaxID=2785915 RepID=UPI0018F7AB66|nr:hypothetical protein [Nucisporomicrobium flavum]
MRFTVHVLTAGLAALLLAAGLVAVRLQASAPEMPQVVVYIPPAAGAADGPGGPVTAGGRATP